MCQQPAGSRHMLGTCVQNVRVGSLKWYLIHCILTCCVPRREAVLLYGHSVAVVPAGVHSILGTNKVPTTQLRTYSFEPGTKNCTSGIGCPLKVRVLCQPLTNPREPFAKAVGPPTSGEYRYWMFAVKATTILSNKTTLSGATAVKAAGEVEEAPAAAAARPAADAEPV